MTVPKSIYVPLESMYLCMIFVHLFLIALFFFFNKCARFYLMTWVHASNVSILAIMSLYIATHLRKLFWRKFSDYC